MIYRRIDTQALLETEKGNIDRRLRRYRTTHYTFRPVFVTPH